MPNESKQKATAYEDLFAVPAVYSWFCDLDDTVQALFAKIFGHIEEFGEGRSSPSSGIPRSKIKKVRGSIWSIRVEQNTNIYRLLYSWECKTCVLLYGFQKKSDKIPNNHMETTDKRLKKYRQEKTPLNKHSPKSKQLLGRKRKKTNEK